MKSFSVFSARGSWFKGNCHTHSTLSDGKSSPEDTLAFYRKLGYDFVVMTDHWKTQPDAAALSSDGFLVINGAEIHPPSLKPGCGPHHILAIGIRTAPPQETLEKATAQRVIGWIERNGGIPIYCHPYWTGHDLDHMKEGRAACGMEVYNTACETGRGLGDSSIHYDHALSAGIRWSAFAVDDAHSTKRDAGQGWIMVKSKALTEKAVLGAIRRGCFYASTGAEIHSLTLRRNLLRIECSPVRKVVWHAEGPFGTVIHAGRESLTQAETAVTDLMRRSKYLRVEITDSKGRKAWSNPIYLDSKTKRWKDA